MYSFENKFECIKFSEGVELQVCFNTELLDSSELLIFVPSLSMSNSNFSVGDLIRLVALVSELDYHLLVINTDIKQPYLDRMKVVSGNTKILRNVVDKISTQKLPIFNNSKYISRINKIGLIGFSNGVEFCMALSQNFQYNIIKGIFAMSPAGLTSCWKVKHNYFHFAGTLDIRNIVYIWDNSNENKTGIILNGGSHEGFLEKNELKPENELSSDLQAKILKDCLSLFFKAVFHNQISFMSIAQYLNAQYDPVFPLYSGNNKQVVEGTYWDNKGTKLERVWCGKVINITPEVVKQELIEQLLFSGIKFITRSSKYNGLKKGIQIHIKKIEDSIELAKNLQNVDTKELTKLIKELYEDALIKKSEFFGDIIFSTELPAIEKFASHLKEFTGRSVIDKVLWKTLEDELKKYKSIFFLKSILLDLKEQKAFPYNQLSYGRTIAWPSKDSRYQIEVPEDIDSTRFTYLALKLAFEHGGKGKIDIDCFFNQNEVSAATLSIHPFISRDQNISILRKFFNYPYYLYGEWIKGNEFNNYLSYYFVRLPFEERVSTIGLSPKDLNGAIMLSEVAFTN